MSAASGLCVFVVDDDPSVLKAMQRVLDAAGLQVATFDSARAFLDAYDDDAEGCLLLDIKMPGIDGLELQDVLAERRCTLPIVFLTGHGDIPMSVRAIKRGAVDFLTKPADSGRLIAVIENAFEIYQQTRAKRTERAAIERRLQSLTAREREVLEHLISGKLNKQVAADLGTVEKTIKVHRARVMQKMQVRSIASLVRLCELMGIKPAP